MELRSRPRNRSRDSVSEEEGKEKSGKKDSGVFAMNLVPDKGDGDDLTIAAFLRISSRLKSSLNSKDFAVPATNSEPHCGSDGLLISASCRTDGREKSKVDSKYFTRSALNFESGDGDDDLPIYVCRTTAQRDRSYAHANGLGVSRKKTDSRVRALEEKSKNRASGVFNLASGCAGEDSRVRECEEMEEKVDDFSAGESNGGVGSSIDNDESSGKRDNVTLSSLFRAREKVFGMLGKKNDFQILSEKEEFRFDGYEFSYRIFQGEEDCQSSEGGLSGEEKGFGSLKKKNVINLNGDESDAMSSDEKMGWQNPEENYLSVSNEEGESGYFGSRRFKVNDMVWAKAYPNNWWPGWIDEKIGSMVAVSFFGCEKRKLFQESDIRGFEENYEVLSKMGGRKLLDSIGCALEELVQRATLGFTCPCQCLMEGVEEGKSKDVADLSGEFIGAKKRFQPVEVLDFVLRTAVCAQFQSAEAISEARAAGQVIAFRRYISIRLDWMYRETMRISESSSVNDDSKGTALEVQSCASSENEMPCFVIQEAESKFRDGEQEDEPVVFSSWQEKGNLEECKCNMQCFSIDSSVEELETLQVDQQNIISDLNISVEEDSSIEEIYVEQNSSAASAFLQLDTEGSSSLSEYHLRTAAHCVDFVTESNVSSGSTLGDNMTNPNKKIEKLHGKDPVAVNSSFDTDPQGLPTSVWEPKKDLHQADMSIAGRECKIDNSLTKRVYSSPEKQNDASAAAGILESNTYSMKTRSGIELQPHTYHSMDPSATQGTSIDPSNVGKSHPLHEMLKHIQYLALDPFYTGSGSMKAVLQNVLNYRKSVYQNIPNLTSQKYASSQCHRPEFQEVSAVDDLLCPAGDAAMTHPNDEVGIANGMMGKGSLTTQSSDCRNDVQLSDVPGAAANVMNGGSNEEVNYTVTSPVDSAKDSSSGKRRLDEPVEYDIPLKLCKIKSPSAVCDSGTCSQIIESKPLPSKILPDPAHAGMIQSLCEMLRCLHCLALDPFYSGKENLKSVQQKVLKCRTLISQSVCNFAALKYTYDGGQKYQTRRAEELSGAGTSLHLTTHAPQSCPDDEDGLIGSGNSKAQLFPNAVNDSNSLCPCDKVDVTAHVTLGKNDMKEVMCCLNCPFDRSGESILGKRRVEELVASNTLRKSLRTHTSSSATKSNMSLQEPTSVIELGAPVDFLNMPQLSCGTCACPAEESTPQTLNEMMMHLRGLALDPFFHGGRCLKCLRQIFLKYKALVYENISDFASRKYTSNGGCGIEATNAQPDNSGHKLMPHFSNGVMETHLVDFGLANAAITEAQISSHERDDGGMIQVADKIDFPANAFCGKSDRREDVCSLHNFQEPHALEPLHLSDAAAETSDDKVCVEAEAAKHVQLPSQIIDGSKKASSGMVISMESSGDSLHQNKKLSQPAYSRLSLKSHITAYYASPLSKDGVSPSIDASQTLKSPGGRTTLNMKFPPNFRLPSKEELVKKFIPFGQLDVSCTRAFFYTGSGQVVFLHRCDAETALRYVKKRNIFGQANVRFWLSYHNANSVKGDDIKVAPLSRAGQLALNTNSCLKRSSAYMRKDKRKPFHVKFTTGNPDQLLSATIPRKNGSSFSGVTCNHSTDVGSDISPHMLLLLEKCNQIVCRIRTSLGLESYYLIFMHGSSLTLDQDN